MESIIASTGNIQIADNESSHVAADSLGITLILRKVLQHSSTIDLLKFSLVNKLWNYEARSMLRNRGNLSANLSSGSAPCQNLHDFASDLQRMKRMNQIIPFSGMTVALRGDRNHENWCDNLAAGEVDQVFEDIRHQIPWKFLSLSFSEGWDELWNCPVLLLVDKIVKNYSGVLEELSLTVKCKRKNLTVPLVQFESLPRLKTLIFEVRGSNTGDGYEWFLKVLVSRAPSLQVLHTIGRINLARNLLERSSAVHVTDFEYSPGLDEIPENLAGQLRCKRLDFQEANQDLNMERFNRITPMLLQASRTTLTSMKVNAMFLVPLTHYGVCLENVKTLDVSFPMGGCEISKSKPSVGRLIESFDFTRIFPNLSTVHINWCIDRRPRHDRTPKAFLDIFDPEIATSVEPKPDRAVNIGTLSLDFRRDILLAQSSEFLVRMFPDIHKLKIRARNIDFVKLWDSWLNLKELDVTLRIPHGYIRNWECYFSGVFPEEFGELLKQHEEYLRSVNIVPVMPSFTCLKGLRTFSFLLEGRNKTELNEAVDDLKFLFSKVTGLLVFQRCPNLTVTIATTNKAIKKALSHMEPYASVVLRE